MQQRDHDTEYYYYADTPYTKANYISLSYYLIIPFLVAVYLSFRYFREAKHFFRSLLIPAYLLLVTFVLQSWRIYESSFADGIGWAVYGIYLIFGYGLTALGISFIVNLIYLYINNDVSNDLNLY